MFVALHTLGDVTVIFECLGTLHFVFFCFSPFSSLAQLLTLDVVNFYWGF